VFVEIVRDNTSLVGRINETVPRCAGGKKSKSVESEIGSLYFEFVDVAVVLNSFWKASFTECF
jgi:hypothetical protein